MMLLIAGLVLAAALVAAALVAVHFRQRNVHLWLASWMRQDWRARPAPGATRHLLFCFVDHFEPQWLKPDYETECLRVERWRTGYPALCEGLRDTDGRPPVHSFFYPGEEYRPEHLAALSELCRAGLGEIDIHLHHQDDDEAGLRQALRRFVGVLAGSHDALPVDPVSGQARWSFIHGNWALDNAHPAGAHCGVNNELAILRDEGCIADFTLPAAPDPCQTSTINRIYYATDDPVRPKSHDTGHPVRVGGEAQGDLMIIQGPLGFQWHHRKYGILPRIENGDVRASAPPTRARIDGWVATGIHVVGRPEWVFVKVHTHGAQERDMDTLLGRPMRDAFEYLQSRYNDGEDWKLHYVSAREMYNIAKAAEAGLSADPGTYRDFVVPRAGFKRAGDASG